MGGLRFAQPELWIFIPIVFVFGVLCLALLRATQKKLSSWIMPGLWKVVLPAHNPRRVRQKGLWLVAAMVFGVLALMRPQYGIESSPHGAKSLDIVVVLDLSNSMNAEDIVPSRLRVTKRAIEALLSALPGDRFALIGFAGVANVMSPLTTDLEYVAEVLQTADPSDIRPQGSDLGSALISARDLQAAASEHPQGRVVVLFTDGEDHEGTFREAAQKLKAAAAISAIVAVGTSRGAPVPQRDTSGRLGGYVKDAQGNTVVTRVGVSTLQAIAKSTGGELFNLSDGEKAIDALIEYLRKAERGELAQGLQPIYRERFQIPLLLMLLCLLIETVFWGRKRGGATTLAAAVVVSLFSTNAFAQERAGSIGAYQRNREALQKLKEEDPKAAAELFSQGRALDPESGTLGFNEGSSRYRAGDFEESLHASEAAQARADQEGNPELYSASAYNRGAALEKLGKKEDAARAYLDGMRKAEAAKLTDLADELRRKLEQVQQDKKQQQQQQEDGEGGHPQQPQQQQQQQQQARRFRSDALTREDAERIMKELANREQGLREKLGKPKGRHGREQNLEKDW